MNHLPFSTNTELLPLETTFHIECNGINYLILTSRNDFSSTKSFSKLKQSGNPGRFFISKSALEIGQGLLLRNYIVKNKGLYDRLLRYLLHLRQDAMKINQS